MASLEELKKRLYRREEKFSERAHSPNISKTDIERVSKRSTEKRVIKINLSKFMGLKMFLAAAGAIVVIVLILFSNVLNFQDIDLKIDGEKNIKSGEKVFWNVTVTNHNKNDIKEAFLVFSVADVFRERVDIGTVKSGDSVEHEFESVIFGGRGKSFEAKALFEYKPEGSSSFFAEEDFFSFVITQSPITVSFSMQEEAGAGSDLNFEVKYFLQSDAKLQNLFLKVNYPVGFEYKNSNVEPVEENNLWEIGDLGPGEEGSIIISGILKDINSGVSNFEALVGSKDGDDFLILDESSHALTFRLPYLGVDILPKGEGKYIASIGEEIPFLVGWKNNLPEIIEDASLEVAFEGESIDLNSVRVRDGSFVSGEKKIIWNTASNKDFMRISPGGSGFAGFSIKIKKNLSLNGVNQNSALKLRAYFKPGKIVPGFESDDVFGEDKIEIPISSAIQFSAKGLYFESPLSNLGPLPPRAGEETTYSIIWSLANPLNDIKNLVVKSTLPQYVNFKEIFLPSSANVVFDKNTGLIEWRVGTLEAGTGFIRPALSLSFQVGVVPSITHIGLSPQIVAGAEASGIDSVTEKVLFASQNEITTDLRDDSQVDFSQKKVVK